MIDGSGQPVVNYHLSAADEATMLAGDRMAAEVMAAAGADTVMGLDPRPQARFLFVEGKSNDADPHVKLKPFASDVEEKIISQLQNWTAVAPGTTPHKRAKHPAFQRWLDNRQKAGMMRGRIPLFSAHQMATARLGVSPEDSVLDPDGQSWDVTGLYAMDASTFPTATGVNPMVTIEAISFMLSSRLARRLVKERAGI